MREIKLRAWDSLSKQMFDNVIYGRNVAIVEINNEELEECGNFEPTYLSTKNVSEEFGTAFEVMQATGQKDSTEREVYELDIYSEMDQGRKLLFIVTCVSEYSAFAMLTIEEFNDYKKLGVKVIEESFEGFYVQLHRESFQKMKYEGNIYENPELLS